MVEKCSQKIMSLMAKASKFKTEQNLTSVTLQPSYLSGNSKLTTHNTLVRNDLIMAKVLIGILRVIPIEMS